MRTVMMWACASFAYASDTRVWMTGVIKLPGHGPTLELFFLLRIPGSSAIRLYAGKKMN